MLKKGTIFLLAIILALAMFPTGQQAEAATTYTFMKAQYKENVAKDGTVTRELTGITLKKSNGKTGTFKVAKTNKYYINNTLTTIDGFKAGMSVTIKVSNNKIIEMRGSTNTEDGSIVPNSKQVTGVVTSVDPNGLQIRVKIDDSSTKTYTVTDNTEVFKGSSSVDLTAIYVGDRVRLKFATANTSRVAEIMIMNSSAVMVNELYKAKLNAVNTSKNTMVLKDVNSLLNWRFDTVPATAQKTFTFTNNTTIYAGHKKISEAQLKNYRNNEIYFVTKKQYSKEIVDKIIVLTKNERTYYLPIEEVTTSVNRIYTQSTGNLSYHKGSILIRNGRLVEPEGLIALDLNQSPISTTAFMITDGASKSEYAHVVNITNDGFLAPNLSRYQLYFGRIDVTDMDAYQLELTDLERFDNHFWQSYNANTQFAFSNSTKVTELVEGKPLKVISDLDLDMYDNYTNSSNPYYGYFYVKDDHVQGIHFVPGEPRVQSTFAGRIHTIDTVSKSIKLQNSSVWGKDGHWNMMSSSQKYDVSKAMIVKNGKVIEFKDLKTSDHVTAIAKGTTVYVLMVNE